MGSHLSQKLCACESWLASGALTMQRTTLVKTFFLQCDGAGLRYLLLGC